MSEAKGIQQGKLKGDSVKPENEFSRRELFKRFSPFGKLELDTPECTGCGLCALECPTGALTLLSSEESDTFQLVFKHHLCVACSQCQEVCPEQCLHLERTLELDELYSPATVLFEDKIVRCSRCGNPIGPRAMVDRIKAKLPTLGQKFELCPTCKLQAQFSQFRI